MYFINGLKGEPVEEISLINLTDWGWMLLLSVIIFVVWLLIIFQVTSKGAHKFGQVSDSDLSDPVNAYGDDHSGPDLTELETED